MTHIFGFSPHFIDPRGLIHLQKVSNALKNSNDLVPTVPCATYMLMPTPETSLLPSTAQRIVLKGAPQLFASGESNGLSHTTHISARLLESDMQLLSAFGKTGLHGGHGSTQLLNPTETITLQSDATGSLPSPVAGMMQWAIEDVSISLGADPSLHEDLARLRSQQEDSSGTIIMDDEHKEFAANMAEILLDTQDNTIAEVVDSAWHFDDYFGSTQEGDGNVDLAPDGGFELSGEDAKDIENEEYGYDDSLSPYAIATEVGVKCDPFDTSYLSSPISTDDTMYDHNMEEVNEVISSIRHKQEMYGEESYSNDVNSDFIDDFNLKIGSALGVDGFGYADPERLDIGNWLYGSGDKAYDEGSKEQLLSNISDPEEFTNQVEAEALTEADIQNQGEELSEDTNSLFDSMSNLQEPKFVPNDGRQLSLHRLAYKLADELNDPEWHKLLMAASQAAQVVRGVSNLKDHDGSVRHSSSYETALNSHYMDLPEAEIDQVIENSNEVLSFESSSLNFDNYNGVGYGSNSNRDHYSHGRVICAHQAHIPGSRLRLPIVLTKARLLPTVSTGISPFSYKRHSALAPSSKAEHSIDSTQISSQTVKSKYPYFKPNPPVLHCDISRRKTVDPHNSKLLSKLFPRGTSHHLQLSLLKSPKKSGSRGLSESETQDNVTREVVKRR